MAKGRILVVDDDIIVRRALARILEDEGYQVQVAASGREALDSATKDAFDVALVDIRIPDLDGMQVLRTLQEMDEDLKGLIITGYPVLETAIQGVRLSVFDYLLKPLDNERVLISVQNALAARQLAVTNRQLLHDLQRANEELRRSNRDLAEAREELAKANEGLRIEVAEHRQAEEALRESEAGYRELADSITDVFFAMDTDLRCTYWNRASEDLTGIAAEDAIGKSLCELFPDTPRTRRAESVYQDVLRTQQPHSFVNEYQLGGRDYCFEISAYPSRRGLSVFVKDITERQRAEEALARERNLLRTLIDNLPDCIYVKDTESRFVVGNVAVARLMGATTPDEVLGKTDFDFYPQELAARYHADEQEIIRSRQPLLNREEPLVDQVTDRRGWLSTTKVPLWDSHGEIVGIVGIGRDITERRRAEEALQDLNRQLTALLDIAAGLETTAGPEEVATRLTRALADRLGYPFVRIWLREGDALKHVTGFGYEEPPSSDFVEIASGQGVAGRVIRTGQPAFVPDVREDSDYRGLADIRSEICCPLRDASGVMGVLDVESRQALTEADFAVVQAAARLAEMGVINARLHEQVQRQATELGQHLAERKEAEEALRESEERFRTIVEAAPSLLVIADQKGTNTYVSPNCEEITGFTQEELQGGFTRWVHEDDTPWARQVFDRVFREGVGARNLEYRAVKKNGDLWYASSSWEPLRDKEGTFKGVVLQTIDITERKRMEEALWRWLRETGRGRRLLLALSQAAQAVQRARSPAEVYRTVGDEVADMGYHAVVFTMADDPAALVISHLTFEPTVVRAAENLAGVSVQDFRLPLVPGGFLQRIIADGAAVFSESAAELMAEGLPGPLRRLAHRLAGLLGLEQTIFAPLTVGGEKHGLLAVTGTGLTEADVPAVTAFANQAAIALENARLMDTVTKHERDLLRLSSELINAQETERMRISRELHDELGQVLTAMRINLAAVEKDLPPGLALTARERLAETSSWAGQILEQVRELALDLRPAMLDDLGLVPTLRWYVNRYTQTLDIDVELEVIDFDQRLPAEVETVLYRVMQEALTNIARHAQANKVHVRLERKESAVAASVMDDGQGFDVGGIAGHRASGPGVGLVGMRERVASLGGTFDVQSRPGEGARLFIQIPLRR